MAEEDNTTVTKDIPIDSQGKPIGSFLLRRPTPDGLSLTVDVLKKMHFDLTNPKVPNLASVFYMGRVLVLRSTKTKIKCTVNSSTNRKLHFLALTFSR